MYEFKLRFDKNQQFTKCITKLIKFANKKIFNT